MPIPRGLNIFSAFALCSALSLVPTAGMTQDEPDIGAQAIETRQGYMKLVVWEAGPLFGMAKGDVAYDAEAAKASATKLKTISQYPVTELFLPGTSNADRPGKTDALPKIWQDASGFQKAFSDWQQAVAALGDQVGNGQPALAAAVTELGKACGGCHKPFRAEQP